MQLRFAQTLTSALVLLPLLLAPTAGARADQDAVAEPGASATATADGGIGGIAGIGDPCKLVTPEEVGAVLGTAVASSSEVHVKDPIKFPVRICSFHAKNGKTLNVSTGLKSGADFATEWGGHDAIAGLGDAAYAVPPDVLVFHKGGSTCKLQALNFGFARDGHGHGYPDPAFAVKLKTLAQAAVARM